MPKKRKQPRVPGDRRSVAPFAPGVEIPPLSFVEDHYGPDVSGVLRVGDFPQRASSYIVQRQMASADKLSGWQSLAVYRSREAAERFIRRMEQSSSRLESINLQTGEHAPFPDQPVSEYRIVTLDDLVREGPLSLAHALLPLITSDHEWLISTEVGSDAKVALMVDRA